MQHRQIKPELITPKLISNGSAKRVAWPDKSGSSKSVGL